MKLPYRNIAALLGVCGLSSSLVEGVEMFTVSKVPFSDQMEITEIPQFITITFDDDVTPFVTTLFRQLIEGITDRRGCGIKSTFFVSLFNTALNDNVEACDMINGLRKGHHEIATHTLNHTSDPSLEDIAAAINYLTEECGIPESKLRGFRTPNLDYEQGTLDHLSQLEVLYDSTITVTDFEGSNYGRNHTWPFTLDEQNIQDFFNCQRCDTANIPVTSLVPGLWEIPMYPFYNIDNSLNTVMDYRIDSTNTIAATLQDSFQRHYYGNRAPLGLYFHASWLASNGPELRNWINFILATYNDAYFVTNTELIEWMRNPIPKSQYQPTCEDQIIDCLPPEGGCVFGSFNSETCECYCAAPYCKDDIGSCTRVCSPEELPPTDNGDGSGSSNLSELDQKCCPNGYSGNRPYDDCQKFYRCDNGVVREITNSYTCGSGLLFDARQRTCLWESDVTCDIRVENVDECGSLQETPSPTSTPTMSLSPTTVPTNVPTTTPTSSQQPSWAPTPAPIWDYDAAEEYLNPKKEVNKNAIYIAVGVVCGIALFFLYGYYVHEKRKK